MTNKTGIIVIILFLLAGCHSTVQSYRDIGNFWLEVHHDNFDKDGTSLVVLTRYNKSSAVYIEKYEICYHKNKAVIRIYQTLNNTGSTGPYDIRFRIPKTIDEVWLENEHVWSRVLLP